ncbi:MAG: PAS domain-containing sensor histidine kinase [Gemmatimonadales bacterium]|nr:MAG: PAS domain-containing sensor histidine kinase [Gemmatimonadales bacterium]
MSHHLLSGAEQLLLALVLAGTGVMIAWQARAEWTARLGWSPLARSIALLGSTARFRRDRDRDSYPEWSGPLVAARISEGARMSDGESSPSRRSSTPASTPASASKGSGPLESAVSPDTAPGSSAGSGSAPLLPGPDRSWDRMTDGFVGAATEAEVLDHALQAVLHSLGATKVSVVARNPHLEGSRVRVLELDPRIESGARSLSIHIDDDLWARVPKAPLVFDHRSPDPDLPVPEGLGRFLRWGEGRRIAASALAPLSVSPDRKLGRERLSVGFLAVQWWEPVPPDLEPHRVLHFLSALASSALGRIYKDDAALYAERRHAELFESVPMPLFEADLDGRIQQSNPAFHRLLGLDPGAPPAEIRLCDLYADPDHGMEWENEVRRGRPTASRVLELTTPRGESVWVEASAARVRGASNGAEVLKGGLLDVTHRIRAETEARVLADALTQSQEAIALADESGTIGYVNPAYLRMTGFRRNQLIGQSLIIRDEHPIPEIWEELRSGGSDRRHLMSRRATGDLFREFRTITPLRDRSGRITHYVSVSRDVSEERALEEQLQQAQKMEAVGRLAGGVAHDFNNLLTVMNGHVQLILAHLEADSPIRGDLEGIIQAGNRASALVDQLLTFSRRRPVETGALDVAAVLRTMESLLQRLINADVELVVEVDPELWPVAITRTRLEQVMANLVVNARDAMPDGGRLLIRAQNLPGWVEGGGKENVLITVSDTGTGIAPEIRDRIFEPFVSTKGEGRGTGLGLSTVYGIVKQAEGEIGVASEMGEGTTFALRFPRATAECDEIDESGQMVSSERMEAFRGTEHILLAEDHDLVRSITRIMLEDFGYRVTEVVDGWRAREILAADPDTYHLVLTDLTMPRLRGDELAAWIRQRRPDFPILYMSGYGQGSGEAAREVPGMPIPTVYKPFTVAELAQAVRERLDRARASAASA